MEATKPGQGRLRAFVPAADRDGGSHIPPSARQKTSKEGAWQPGGGGQWASSSGSPSGASSSHQTSAWGQDAWNRPYHSDRARGSHYSSWQQWDEGSWSADGWSTSGGWGSDWSSGYGGQGPRQDTWTRPRGDSLTEAAGGDSSPPWRNESSGWTRPRAGASPVSTRPDLTPPRRPRPGTIGEGPATAPGFFVKSLQRISKGWSDLWILWRGQRPLPPSGYRTNDPVLVHDEALTFVQEFSLEDLMREWQERARRNPAPPEEGGRGMRRTRDNWEGERSDGGRTARPRR